jgi:lysophospholipase L1-like esterase
LAPLGVAAAEAPLPSSMAAVGDSITRAASTGGILGADAPQNSWSTGTSTSVNSHYLRLIDAGADIGGRNHNLAVSGAKVGGLQAQMQNAVAVAPDYLTVLIGGNDLCTDTIAEMTPVTVFRDQFRSAMATLSTGLPDTRVYVVSIPDVYQLWSLFRNNFFARLVWASADICQSLLANPGSTQPADVERRAAVRQRNIDYNAAMAEVCAQFERCLFDGNAVFNTQLTMSDVSGDYFHPSGSGQARLASVSWDAGYTWTTETATMTVASLTGSSAAANRNTWTASVTILVVDGDGGAVAGATVTTAWSAGAGDSCTTGPDGRCSVTSDTFNRRKVASVTLTVTDVSHATLAYVPSITSVAVSRPA